MFTKIRELIDYYLILPKLLYMSLNLAVYSTHTFTAMYFYKEWNLEIWQYGFIATLAAIHFLTAPLWGRLADKTGWHRILLLSGIAGYAGSFGLLQIKGIATNNRTGKVVWTGFLYGLSFVFNSGLFPLVDEQMLRLLKSRESSKRARELFGRQRLFGSLGHGLATLITGIGIDKYGFLAMFFNLFISCGIFSLLVLILIPVKYSPSDEKKIKEVNIEEESILKNKEIENEQIKSTTVGVEESKGEIPLENNEKEKKKASSSLKLFKSVSFLLFLLMVFCSGYVRAVLSLYLPFYLQKDHNLSATLVAIAKLCQVASEVVLFGLGKYLYRVASPPWLVLMAQVSGIGRAFAYAFLPPRGSWYFAAFGIELLKGASTALAISGGVIMAEELANKAGHGLETFSQGMFSGVYTGLASAAGGSIGGLILMLLPNHSISTLFLITAIAASVTTVIFGIKYFYFAE
jgi:MFS family permease